MPSAYFLLEGVLTLGSEDISSEIDLASLGLIGL